MTIYELCMSKALTYEYLRNDELTAGNAGNARIWTHKMDNARRYAKELPIEVADFELTSLRSMRAPIPSRKSSRR